MGGGQLLTFFNGCCLADLLKIKHRKHLQNLLLLRSFLQKALLDHPRQIRRGQFLESSPRCSRLAQNMAPEVSDHDCSSHLPPAHPFYPDSSSLTVIRGFLIPQGGRDGGMQAVTARGDLCHQKGLACLKVKPANAGKQSQERPGYDDI